MIPEIELQRHPDTGEWVLEEWKGVLGYEGLYEVSNYGRIKSHPREFQLGGSTVNVDEAILAHWLTNGYPSICLCQNGQKKFKIHRLVAIHFCPNPNELPVVNHKDGIKQNIIYFNLEWCTSKYNNEHALSTGLKVMPSGKDHYNSKTIIDSISGKEYNSVVEASEKLNLNANTLRSMLGGFRKNKTSLTFK